MKKLFAFAALLCLLSVSAFASPAEDCNSNEPKRMLSGCGKLISTTKQPARGLAILYNRLGVAKKRLGDRAGAEADFTRAIKADRKYPHGWTNRADVNRLLGKFAESVEDATRAISLQPSAYAYETRALARASLVPMTKVDRIVADARRAIELNPKSVLAYVALAEVYRAEGQFAKALEEANKLIANDGTQAWEYSLRADYNLRLGRLDDAARDIVEGRKLDPNFIGLDENEGALSLDRGNTDRALALYTKVLERDPKRVQSRVNRGMIYLQQNKLDPALADFEAAGALNYKSAVLYFNWAMVKMLKGDLDAADRYINQSLEINENVRNVQYVRGLIRWARGEKDEAELDFKEAVERDPALAGRRKSLSYFANARISSSVPLLPPKPGAKKPGEDDDDK